VKWAIYFNYKKTNTFLKLYSKTLNMKNLFLFLLLGIHIQISSQSLVVNTINGKVKGTFNADQTIKIFKGIPFAAPPIGDLRWKAPQPVKNWTGELNANTFSASPIQNKPEPFYCWSEEFIAQPEPLSEDCLYLNIWANSQKEKKPVFVWIYGGGLSSGSANCAIYDGEEMAKKGVVFVSINYRVGVFGFMAHSDLSKESGYNASGNYGFLDQIAALRWVEKNIVAFGGDPNNVTIAGQSAGSFSVNALIASPLAKGLFHKAIAQSGGLLGNTSLTQNLKNAESQGQKVLEKANVKSIVELRKIPANDLQKLCNDAKLGRFGTTLDNYVLPENLLEHFKKGLQNKVPTLAGWVTGDGGLMGVQSLTLEKYKKEAVDKYGKNAETFLTIFPVNNDEEVKIAKTKQGLLSFAGMPAHLLAKFNPKNTFLYEFSHVPVAKPNFPDYGAFHTAEVPYALHTLHKWNRSWQQIDKDLENKMASYWVNFAKTGYPNAEGMPLWQTYDKQHGNIMQFGDEVKLITGLFKKEFEFLEKEVLNK
jgi:para-nitrobenzyl esterase